MLLSAQEKSNWPEYLLVERGLALRADRGSTAGQREKGTDRHPEQRAGGSELVLHPSVSLSVLAVSRCCSRPRGSRARSPEGQKAASPHVRRHGCACEHPPILWSREP